ncbi:MAG: NAD-dependent DNA ligase LigA [Mycoplasmataceae bacterium]|nr:NAD-dependent DNA ligase LigA [Mycoplasmataceae bacterium]
MDDIIKRVLELTNNINKWNYEYYYDDKPSVSDEQYDAAVIELKSIEEKYPELKSKNSPSSRVGGYVSEKFEKYTHKYPMLSLNNAFNQDDMLTFRKQIDIEDFDNSFIVEPKIDGLSLSLIYSKGILIKGVTRGDGIVGEDVTNNVLVIQDVPQIIKNDDEYFEVRGEVYISNSNFNRINLERKSSGLVEFANPRNAASGTLRQLDSNIVRKRKLSFFAYEIIGTSLESQSKKISTLKKLGFKTSNLIESANGIDDVMNKIRIIESKRDKIDFEIDGVVIKINNVKFHNLMGRTSKFPKWAIAYKLASEVSVTKLIDIVPTIGRTGKVTYNARLESVRLAGTLVKNATLHNSDYIKENDIRIGDYVSVKKAGDIIPKVIGPVLDRREVGVNKWDEANVCPGCNSKLMRLGNDVDQYCLNKKCELRKKESLIYFCSKVAMNIDNLGESIIRDFFDRGFIRKYSDIYKLDNYSSEILSIKGYKDKTLQNILSSIEISKKNSVERLITGLGIKHIGPKAAKEIASYIKNLTPSSKLNLEDIRGIGEKIEKSWNSWMKIDDNIQEIIELEKAGVNLNYISNSKSEKLSGLKFVITGKLNNPRTYYVGIIESNGGKVTSQISNSTDYLLIGKDAGSKLDKAKKNNITVIDEDNFEEIITKVSRP